MHLIWDLICQWSQGNLDIVFFIYGLAFLAMGIAIWVQPKKESRFKLANILWLLAGFGLIHGTNEFLDMWAIIKGRSPVLDLLRGFMLVISYLFLFEFGRRLFRICEQKYLKKFAKLFGWWLTLIIGLTVFIFGFISTDIWKIGSIWARYLLGFPSGLLITFGFVFYYECAENELRPLRVKKYFFWASLSFLVYGILGGLVVPKANFFPSNWLNTDSFLLVMRIPVQVFRAICAIIIAWTACGMLRIFHWETLEKLQREITERKRAEEKLQRAHDDLEIRIQERTKELTKANELLRSEIAERRKAEEALKTAYEQLKTTHAHLVQSSKMASIGQLAAGLAHEINNPLTGVLNNVQLMKMLMEQKTDATLSLAEFKDFFNAIEESALRCKKITQSLLDFSHASKATTQPILINEIVEKVINLISYELRLQNVIIQTDFSGQLPLIQGNPQLLQQVFMNLIANSQWAIKKKSGTEGGLITIRTHYDSQNNRVNIDITDTGIGMSPEIASRIFEPFFTTKEVGEGTGLGMSVVYGIIQDHKGTIEVESEVDKGTTFKISLPAFHQKETV